jgi:hypothetical protein
VGSSRSTGTVLPEVMNSTENGTAVLFTVRSHADPLGGRP